jgi:hypothetical protein
MCFIPIENLADIVTKFLVLITVHLFWINKRKGERWGPVLPDPLAAGKAPVKASWAGGACHACC